MNHRAILQAIRASGALGAHTAAQVDLALAASKKPG
jgi:hypothetical protein